MRANQSKDPIKNVESSAVADSSEWARSLLKLCQGASGTLSPNAKIYLQISSLDEAEVGALKLPRQRFQRGVKLSVKDPEGSLFPPLTGVPSDQPTSDGPTRKDIAPLADVVEELGGVLKVERNSRARVEYEILLPAEIPDRKADAAKKPVNPLAGHGESILLVDDEKSVRMVLVRVLRASGYQVFEAADGIEGLKQLAEHLKDVKVVIADLIMPRMDGSEFVRAASRLKPALKVITVSGLGAATVESGERDDIVQTHLTKPFGPEDMLRALQQAVQSLETTEQ
ncbi:MAG: hypothetical protein RLY20_3558 [Verrucomicrobiota bacterium]|jgi:CheY-like chemotaxis protein